MKTTLIRLLAVSALPCILEPLRAELITFDVDPARSSLNLSGTAAGSPLQEQSPGSLSNAFTGTILVDVTENQVRFPGGGRVEGLQNRSFEPGADGGTGTAPAAYGAKAAVTVVVFKVDAHAAARSVAFDIGMGDTASLQNGGFAAGGLRLQIPESAGTKLDYRTLGSITLKGSAPVVGIATNAPGQATLSEVNSVLTLSLPLEASFPFDLLSTGDTTVTFRGRLVATRRAGPVTPPEIVFTPPPPGGGPLTLAWPAGFRLQKATRLSPADWVNLDVTSPFVVPPAAPGEFFRVVRITP